MKDKSRKNGEFSSDFDEESDISSFEEYKTSKNKKKDTKINRKEHSTRITRQSSLHSQKKDFEEESTIKTKKETKKNLSKNYKNNEKQNSFIKNWINVKSINKTLFETVEDILEQSTWPCKYVKENALNHLDQLILNDYLKKTSLKLYIGAHESSKLHIIERFSSYSLNKMYPSKTGYIIYTGFPIWGLDWCPGYSEGKQYLAVSGHPDYETHSMLLYPTEPKKSVIQIWSFVPGSNDDLSNEPLLEIIILHTFGSTWNLKWCPLTSKIHSTLGFLAAIFSDGSAKIFSVPLSNEPGKTLFMKLEHVELSFSIHDTRCTCLCWISSNRIAIGASNGQICVFDLEKENPTIPIISFFAHSTYIRNITSCSSSYPNLLISSAYDCTIKVTDIRDPLGDMAFIQRQRAMNFIVEWWDKLSCIILSDNTCGLRFTFFESLQSSNHIISIDGTLWAVAISPLHPFIAASGADGTVTIVNFAKKTFSKLRQPLSIHKIYQLSISYEDMSYLIVENFIPEKYQKSNSTPIIFPPEIGITVVSWNPSKKYGGWLASGSTSGILRVEDLSL